MGHEGINRFDRIVAILIQLQSKRVVRAHELADRFQVSLRTIYRDIRTLETSGVPIASEAGVGYSIMEGYRLPPIMFTREEAGSFVAAEKLMQKFTDRSLGAYHGSAMYKIKSVLRGREKDLVNTLESQISVDLAEQLFNDGIPDALEILLESIAGKKQVFLKYHSLEAYRPKIRNIEPVGLFHKNNYWYVLGYCHYRNDYRQFRTDRMLQIQRTEIDFTMVHGSLEDHLGEREDCEKIRVRILVDKHISRYIKGNRGRYGFVSEKTKDNFMEMTFMCSDLENGFARWYLTFADYAHILEPDNLKDRVRSLLKRMEQRLLAQ